MKVRLQWDEAKALFSGGAANEDARGDAGEQGARVGSSREWGREAQADHVISGLLKLRENVRGEAASHKIAVC